MPRRSGEGSQKGYADGFQFSFLVVSCAYLCRADAVEIRQKSGNGLNTSAMQPSPCAIDALRLLVPYGDPLRPEFSALRREVQQYFPSVEDYRPYDLPIVILPRKQGFRRGAPLVIDIIGVGKLSGAAIVETMQQVVAGDPLKLPVGYVDLTADWLGGSVALCRQAVSIRQKRKAATYWNESGNAETLYFGCIKSNNFYRIYDKAAQLRTKGDTDVPDGWTRIERRISRQKLPAPLRTLGGLLTHGADFFPFSEVQVSPPTQLTFADFEHWVGAGITPVLRRNAFWAYELRCEHGDAGARRRLRHEGRKASTEMENLARAEIEIGKQKAVIPNFDTLYREAFSQQIQLCSITTQVKEVILPIQSFKVPPMAPLSLSLPARYPDDHHARRSSGMA